MTTEATHPSERGTAFGILFGFQLGGGATVVYVCGIVADAFDNPSYALLIVSLLAIASVGISVRLWNRNGRAAG